MALIPRNLKELRLHLKDPLFKNSYYILMTSGSVSVFGFLFWIIVARFHSSNDVGYATALLSMSQLICIFSALGLNYSLIRYFQKSNDKNKLINTCFSINMISVLILTFFFILSLKLVSPTLIEIRDNYLLFFSFIILTFFYSIFTLQGHIFIAARSTEFYFYQNLVFNSLKVLFPLLFIYFGLFGIISSWTLSAFIALILGSVLFIRKILPNYKFKFMIDRTNLKEIITFSLGNYFSSVFSSLPMMIMPLLIINILEVDSAAFFYVAWSIALIFSTILSAMTMSLFAEGSNNSADIFRINIIKSVKFIFLLLIPGTIFLILFGDKLLLLYGQQYSISATKLLWLLGIGNIPYAVNQLYITIKRVEIDIKPIVYINIFTALFVIIGSYVLMKITGLLGIGIAWIFGQSVISIIVLIILWRKYKNIHNNNLKSSASIFH